MYRLLCGLAACTLTASSTFAQVPGIPDLPDAIKPAGLTSYLEVPATGFQTYTCAKTEGGAWSWVFKGPEAALYDKNKKLIGKHYGGPTWESLDGGKVVGAVKANAPAPGDNAIPWLLLDVKSKEGKGPFAQAKGILRVATTGGLAPTQGCDEPRNGSELKVPYTALYLFLK